MTAAELAASYERLRQGVTAGIDAMTAAFGDDPTSSYYDYSEWDEARPASEIEAEIARLNSFASRMTAFIDEAAALQSSIETALAAAQSAVDALEDIDVDDAMGDADSALQTINSAIEELQGLTPATGETRSRARTFPRAISKRAAMTDDDIRTVLQAYLDEIDALQYEENPDTTMLADMRADIVAMQDAGIDDADMATVARELVTMIDDMLAEAAAGEKSTIASIETRCLPVPIAIRAMASNVSVVAPATRRFRAVVTRSIRQVAVVEFDGQEGADMWALSEDIVAQVPDAA